MNKLHCADTQRDMGRRCILRKSMPLLMACCVFLLPMALSHGEAAAPARHDGSRTPPVHLLPLLDNEGNEIIPTNNPDKPFSTRFTCGECHDYDAIRQGWHFNAAAVDTQAGRPGEPWFIVDDETGTQIPVSSRAWPGVWQPEALGLVTTRQQ